MEKHLIMTALCVSACTTQAVQLDIAGLLFTDAGIETVPIEVSYNPAGAIPWVEESYTLATPEHGDLDLSMTVGGVTYTRDRDADYPQWPGIILLQGEPYALDFVVLDPVPGVWRLGTAGLLIQDRTIGGETIPGWSVQAYADTALGRLGMASNPVPAAWVTEPGAFGDMTLLSVPEPGEYALLAGFALIGFAASRRRI